MFFAFVPVIVFEGLGPFAALGRSRRLSKGARLRVFGVCFLAWVIAALPGLAFSAFAGIAIGGGMFSGFNPATLGAAVAFAQAGAQVLSALTTPFSVGVVVLLYLDRRARTEAPDLEAAAARLTVQV
jgi:hypothetical protein